jgi:hypothetical protein
MYRAMNLHLVLRPTAYVIEVPGIKVLEKSVEALKM